MVKFSSVHQRNSIFYNKKKLKGTKMVLVEELTQSRYNFLQNVKERIDNGDVWTKNGRIFVKLNGKKHCVRSFDDLTTLMDNENDDTE